MNKEPMFIHFFDAVTGETIQREMTPEEVADREALIADAPALPSAE
jgi:hypothetical protein